MEEEITRQIKVRRTVYQMLRDRGYRVEDSDINLKREEFVQRFVEPVTKKVNTEALFIETDKAPNPSDKVYVFFENEKVRSGQVTSLTGKMKADNVRRGILVVRIPMSAPAKKLIADFKSITLEVFEEAELVTNVTEHRLVNEYHVLDDKAKEELLNKYSVKETQLPRILVTDPVARYYGLKKGQIVKIRRSDLTSTDYFTYRCAV